MTVYTILDIAGNVIESWEVPATPYGGCCVSGGDSNPLTIAGNELASVGDLYTASGGIPPYVFSFPEGTISTSGTVIDVGEILSITACGAPGDPRTGTIIVTDSIGQTDSKVVRLYGGEFVEGQWVCPTAPVLAGSEDINVGDFFTVTSGGVAPYVFTFPEGTISDEGEILTIDACASSGASRAGTVSVTDASGQTDSIEGRLTGGGWQGVPGYVPAAITGTVTRLNDYCIFSPIPLIVGGFQIFGRVSVWTWDTANGNVVPSSSPVSAGSVCPSAQTAYDAIDQTDDFKAAIDWRTLSVNEWVCP